MDKDPERVEKQLLSIPEFAKAHGLGRSTVYRLLAAGELKAVKIGKRTAIATADAAAWLGCLETYKPTRAA